MRIRSMCPADDPADFGKFASLFKRSVKLTKSTDTSSSVSGRLARGVTTLRIIGMQWEP